jgi:arginase
MHVDEESGIRNAEAIAEYAVRQSGILRSCILEKSFSVVIAGDCSILIGNTFCLKILGN